MSLIDEFIDRNMPEAWAGCLRWSVGNAKVIEAFTAETGLVFNPPANAFEAAIDEASGLQESIVRQYLAWFNQRVWGETP